ncbi:hypothetical protein, partial [Mycobacterium marinum]
YLNPGNYNTGLANSGDVNTGAFISGDYSNGAFWRGDHQGLVGFSYAINIPETPGHAEISIPIDIPINGTIGDINTPRVRIPEFPLNVYVFTPIHVGDVGPIVLPPIRITGPTLTGNIGGPTTSIDIGIGGTLGPAKITIIDIPAAPGFGNSTTSPSSGFFNSGDGSVSGFGNFGDHTSGLVNFGSGNSGAQNVGALQSGLANLGDTVSGA